ncbi:MAG TPA: BadF/BadG/BcrA/BcrD ATPase family protein [bacterium]|nr:BadF/BadG/BcrA/BcrD ATPase family protein [bacterium]
MSVDVAVKNTLSVGIDVGSTTVKAVVLDSKNSIIWKKYERHNTKQPELVRDLLTQIENAFPQSDFSLFITGSGSRAIAESVNAHYIQEVNAVCYAVESMHPDVSAVIELGGQDAKVIIWKGEVDDRSTLSFMNDKCAGGTGATIDKILDKIGLSTIEANKIRAHGKTINHIAAKCGVFAETDVVGLLKAGVAKEDIFVSLCTAIVKQNLEVLVRGNVLKDKVLLLGGPHTYLPALTDIWREQLPVTWKIHKFEPVCKDIEKAIFVPEDSQYFAATGAVLFGRKTDELSSNSGNLYIYKGTAELDAYIAKGRLSKLESSGAIIDGLVQSDEEVIEFAKKYSIPEFIAPEFEKGKIYECYLGIDGGSTSTKLVLINRKKEILYKDYLLSNGNPVSDVREMFVKMEKWRENKGIEIKILGSAVTGYASAILKTAFNLDKAIVETVAHMKSAVAYYGEIDLICDIGGQDIKVLFMKHGRVVDFKLNTQCSAGNGFFLQGMAAQFGIPVEKYAEHAFKARKAPAFNYGCAVFMEQDKVNFQQLGWSKEEIMAGLALVLPKNIWNYVVQESNIARLGKNIVLQGGTQKNLAAVKAQVDYIKSRIPDARVNVHRYADICGAIGAAMVAVDSNIERSSFTGIADASTVEYSTRNDESTRCRFCTNKCPRAFIDIKTANGGHIRFISGNQCEKGMAESAEDMREFAAKRDESLKKVRNLVDEAAHLVFSDFEFEKMPENGADIDQSKYYPKNERRPVQNPKFEASPKEVIEKRKKMVIGIPKLLNMYLYSPFFSTYLRTLGMKVVYSDYTSDELWAKGNKWGAIDPCFPAKVAPAHIYNLLLKKECTHICFPIITHLHSSVLNTLGNNACVIQMGTPEVVNAVFKRETDFFADNGIDYWRPLVSMDNPVEINEILYEYFKEKFELTSDENAWAVNQGLKAMACYYSTLQTSGAEVVNDLILHDKMGILLVGHPYHHDPGLNHKILEKFQLKGFPVLCIESLPDSASFIDPLFKDEETEKNSFDITDVWGRNFNRNTNLKIMAARVAARHTNLAVIDLSSFKCGHDAPTYSYIDNILDASATPHFLFHDIDQNKPGATFNIRIETIEYFLKHEELMLKGKK